MKTLDQLKQFTTVVADNPPARRTAVGRDLA